MFMQLQRQMNKQIIENINNSISISQIFSFTFQQFYS